MPYCAAAWVRPRGGIWLASSAKVVARTGERPRHRHGAEVEAAVVRDGPVPDVDHARAAEKRVGRCHVALDGRAGGDDLERRSGRVQARRGGGPSASASGFCATARISPVDGLIATIIAFLPAIR